MALKKYTIKYPDIYWECEIEIDEDFITPTYKKSDPPVTTKDRIKQMVEFWSDWEDRLEDNDGDYTKTFLQQLASRCLEIVISNNYNLFGVIGEFEEAEGWFKMNGSYGITITSVDDFEFQYSEFQIEEKND